MLTCLCDAIYGDVGIATVKVLEHLGCEVEFDPRQTCCGQPPFNAGDWETARSVARHCRTVFEGDAPLVTPSGSCAAMLREGYEMLFPGERPPKAFELSEFIVHELGIQAWPAKSSYEKRVGFHRSCHGRMLGLRTEARDLVASVPGVEIVEFDGQEQCCGFGGAFCVTQGGLSQGIGLEKLRTLVDKGVEEVVSGDMGCLMHLEGLSEREGFNLRFRHFAQVLAEVAS
jgi:L-lactate dehydrogenase complex protein LldE